ncbi:DUF3726 domain-containing protein [uncultured Tateyamaria sp.]|uniref:DUF3726 domain-containing protein n=1 Tax=uncultured Tateyamaria sp. TaxID=455651 RepID=UPI00261F3783|nr:DUF3726 domain-containing protein [uncultured Tateyamaria sp.]
MYSLNEIEALSKRAARGAGLPWGLAEEAGKATRCLSAWGKRGPELLAALLAQIDTVRYADALPLSDEGPWRGACGWLCPIAAGAAVSDRAAVLAAGGDVTLGRTACPDVLVPFVSMAAVQAGVVLRVKWARSWCDAHPDGTAVWGGDGDERMAWADQMNVVPMPEAAGAVQDAPARCPTDPKAWQTLIDFGHRTLAPNTEASRTAGAGPA